MFSKENFLRELANVGATNHSEREDSPLFEQVAEAYDDPSRHYHSRMHIDDCLRSLDTYSNLASNLHEVAVALWFHDVVYNSKRTDNEEQSAKWAQLVLDEGGVEETVRDRIVALILATRTHDNLQTHDEELMIDIDLKILGQSEDSFQVYDEAIRKEFAWVPQFHYRKARRGVLQTLLDREHIYHTQTFRNQFESAARENLERTIKTLS